VFDLKGSMVNRHVPGENHKPTSTLKDRNLIDICRENIYLRFRPNDIRKINDRLREDATILKMFNLMDYSILLCIEENIQDKHKTKEEIIVTFDNLKKEKGMRHQFISDCGKWIYHLSVIDYLQDYNCEKRGENFLKTNRTTAENAKLISAVHPDDYATRFIAFIKTSVIINQMISSSSSEKIKPHSLVESLLSHSYITK
jgi:hypothetical protein